MWTTFSLFEEFSTAQKRRSNAKLFECDSCKRNFQFKSSLQRHTVNKCSNSSEDKIKFNVACLYCSETFKNIVQLRRHFQKYYVSEKENVSVTKWCFSFYFCAYCSSVLNKSLLQIKNVFVLLDRIESLYNLRFDSRKLIHPYVCFDRRVPKSKLC